MKFLLALLLAGASVPGAPPSVPAEAAPTPARSWHIEDFHVDLRVHTTGRVAVTERIRVRFEGAYNGIFRDIPIEYRQRGFNYTLRLSDIEVTDGVGNPLEFERSRERHLRRLKIWIPDARDAARTVEIRYTVENALQWFEEDDREWTELYWNVTGDEWTVPIDRASARVVLPQAATGIRARTFTGSYRSQRSDADIRVDVPIVHVNTRDGLGIREGLTVTTAFDTRIDGDPDGAYVIPPPTTAEKLAGWLRSNWPLFLPIFVFFAMHRVWVRFGRDPERLSVAPRYQPPEGLTVSEAGALVDNRVHMRDVTAMVVDLGIRGYLKIRKEEGPSFLGLELGGDSYEFELLRARDDWGELAAHEVKLLDGMFDGRAGDRVTTSDLKNRFYEHLSGIKDAVWEALVEHGMYRSRPDRVIAAWLVVAAVIGIGGSVFGAAVLGTIGMSVVTSVTAAGLSGLIVAAFGLLMPARTRAGARKQEEVMGFEDFLDRVEADRFDRLITDPEMFERYLPYAMAFGVEDRWAAAFADIYRDRTPDWYAGPVGTRFHAAALASDLSGMATSTEAVMRSAPRSSGGSGFSGGGSGGFSGGGFGGGGGGAF